MFILSLNPYLLTNKYDLYPLLNKNLSQNNI